jgi:hypothetical protein
MIPLDFFNEDNMNWTDKVFEAASVRVPTRIPSLPAKHGYDD